MTTPCHADVAVIGAGPTGITLAGLLARHGLSVMVFDRALKLFAQPRAVGFDQDAMRLFQRLGAAQALAPHVVEFSDTEFRGAAGQVIRRVRRVEPPYPYSWPPNLSCDQPGVEAVLRRTVGAMPQVRMQLGWALEHWHEDAAGVSFTASAADEGAAEPEHFRTRFLIGCDGASSTVRKALGTPLESLDYDEPWLVVDLKVGAQALSRLPTTNVQYCEPERPCTYIVCPGNHRRWEFMLLPGEPREGALEPRRLWELLARWLQPHEAVQWRAAAYRFHALIARDWQSAQGRVLLAGDAAHQTPPFMGQGLCQGLRDAGNLAWKLAAVLRDGAPAALLHTYATERRPHVQATTALAKAFGEIVSERDPARAAARDAQLLREGGGTPRTLVRQELIPPLATGLIASDAPWAGVPLPQPRVRRADGSECLMDEVLAAQWRVVVVAPSSLDALGALGTSLPTLRVQAPGTAATLDGPGHVQAISTLLHDAFAATAVGGAIVRPDHCVYGAFATTAQAEALLDSLQATGLVPQARAAPAARSAPAIAAA